MPVQDARNPAAGQLGVYVNAGFNRSKRNFLPVRSGSRYPRCTRERRYRLASRRIAHRAPLHPPRNLGSRGPAPLSASFSAPRLDRVPGGFPPRGWGQTAPAGPLRERGVETIKLVNAKARPAWSAKHHPSAPPVLSRSIDHIAPRGLENLRLSGRSENPSETVPKWPGNPATNHPRDRCRRRKGRSRSFPG